MKQHVIVWHRKSATVYIRKQELSFSSTSQSLKFVNSPENSPRYRILQTRRRNDVSSSLCESNNKRDETRSNGKEKQRTTRRRSKQINGRFLSSAFESATFQPRGSSSQTPLVPGETRWKTPPSRPFISLFPFSSFSKNFSRAQHWNNNARAAFHDAEIPLPSRRAVHHRLIREFPDNFPSVGPLNSPRTRWTSLTVLWRTFMGAPTRALCHVVITRLILIRSLFLVYFWKPRRRGRGRGCYKNSIRSSRSFVKRGIWSLKDCFCAWYPFHLQVL